MANATKLASAPSAPCFAGRTRPGFRIFRTWFCASWIALFKQFPLLGNIADGRQDFEGEASALHPDGVLLKQAQKGLSLQVEKEKQRNGPDQDLG